MTAGDQDTIHVGRRAVTTQDRPSRVTLAMLIVLEGTEAELPAINAALILKITQEDKPQSTQEATRKAARGGHTIRQRMGAQDIGNKEAAARTFLFLAEDGIHFLAEDGKIIINKTTIIMSLMRVQKRTVVEIYLSIAMVDLSLGRALKAVIEWKRRELIMIQPEKPTFSQESQPARGSRNILSLEVTRQNIRRGCKIADKIAGDLTIEKASQLFVSLYAPQSCSE